MAEDKRVRISADLTPLKQLREEAVSLYREVDQASANNALMTERNLQQLREQLSLMEDRNELEKLLIDLRRQASAIDTSIPQVQQPIQQTVPQIEQRGQQVIPQVEEPMRQVAQSESEQRRPEQPQQPFAYDEETNSVTWDLEPSREQKPIVTEESISEEIEKPKKKRRKRKAKQEEDAFEGVVPEYDEETNSLEWTPKQREETDKPKREKVNEVVREITNETLREINRHVENIDNSVTNTDNSKKTENNREETIENNRKKIVENTRNIENNREDVVNDSRNIENNREDVVNNSRRIENNEENVVNNSRNFQNNNEDIVENVKNIDRNVVNINENTTPIKEKDPVEAKPDFATERRESREIDFREPQVRERKEGDLDVQRQEVFSDENILKAIGSLESTSAKGLKDVVAILEAIEKENSTPKQSQSSINRYLEALTNSISLIEDGVDEIRTTMSSGGSGSGGSSGGSGGASTPIIPPTGSGGGGGGMSFIGGAGNFLKILGGLAILNNIKNTLVERTFRNREADLRSEYQSTVETGANYKRVEAANEADVYRWIPLVGDIIARSIEMPANIAADRMIATVQKYLEAETKLIPYAQTFGGSPGDALKIASQEGSYAASALGIDSSTYIQRRTELTRAAGGRSPGGTEFDPTARREAQSLMAAERLYGINPNEINKLQGSLRFSGENTSYGGSAIIREFERGMKELNLPFREIASTIEESLETFNKRADDILSKAGEFDAGRIVALLNGIRTATGLEGRQLERVQTAFSGSGISQDEVTQALLLRTLTTTDPNVRTYSEAMEKLESVQSGNADPEFMRSFLLELQGLTQNNEQFINILKGVFPNLSWNDIRKQFAEGDPSSMINNIYDKVNESFRSVQAQPREAYDPREAERTVGAGEKITASDTNRQVGIGAESLLEVLEAIRDGVQSIDGKIGTDFKNYIDSFTGQFKNIADVIGGKTDIDTAGKKASMMFLLQMANWTKITHRLLGIKEDER